MINSWKDLVWIIIMIIFLGIVYHIGIAIFIAIGIFFWEIGRDDDETKEKNNI